LQDADREGLEAYQKRLIENTRKRLAALPA
jgi:hypothetical protein